MDIFTGHLAHAAAVVLVIPAHTAMSTSNARAISQPLTRPDGCSPHWVVLYLLAYYITLS